jgi:hypothetical protein
MSGSSEPIARRSRRVPAGLLGMLALVLLVESFIGSRRLDFTTVWADDWRRSAEAAIRRVQKRDVLCFGDSLVKFAVLPKQIEAKTGLRSYNLALNAGTMPSAYFLLRQTLGAGSKPKAIVADFCTLMQPDRPLNSIRMYPDLATTRDCFELAWIARDPDFLASTLLGKLFPSYKCRFEIQQSIQGALGGLRASPWPSQATIWETWKHQDGAQPMPSDGSGGSLNPQMVADLSPVGWKCDAINAIYAEKFLELAASKQIPVFWLIPPLNPAVHALRAVQGSDEAFTRFVKTVLAQHPDVVVLDARRSGYERTVYVDTLHLDSEGARVLSTDLAKLLLDRLASKGEGPRWVDLPPFDRRKAEVAAGAASRRK